MWQTFKFSWKQKLIAVIFITLFGLMLVSVSAFWGLRSVNGNVNQQSSVIEFEKFTLSLAYDLLSVESLSTKLDRSELSEYRASVLSLPENAELIREKAQGLENEKVINYADSILTLIQQYETLRVQWLELSDILGFSPDEGAKASLYQASAGLEAVSLLMIEDDISSIVKAQERFLISRNKVDSEKIEVALASLEEKVIELQWEENKLGKAVSLYRQEFDAINALIKQESQIIVSLLALVDQLNQTLAELKQYMEENILEQVIANASNAYKTAAMLVLMISVCVGLIILTSLGGITKQLYLQLKQVQVFLKQLAQGDFSDRLTLNKNANDEFTQLRKANNEMLEDMSNVIALVVDGNKDLLGVGEDLELAVEKLVTNSVQIEDKAQQSAEATQQISIAVNDVAKRSVDVSNNSQSASESTKKGGKVVTDCVDSMRDISNLIGDVHSEAEKLGQSTAKMMGIIDVINGLADQTNLLALNAAIESARAGEAGRGFSVVADEVRALAQKTVNATSNIAGIISGFTDQSERMVTLMDKGIKLASSGHENANNALTSFSEIEQAIQNVASEMDQVVVAVEEISHNANDIADQVTNIGEQTVTTKDIRLLLESHTHKLYDQANDLSQITGRFKLANK